MKSNLTYQITDYEISIQKKKTLQFVSYGHLVRQTEGLGQWRRVLMLTWLMLH